MKIVLDLDELYQQMRNRKIETVADLSRLSGVPSELLYRAVIKRTASKETYWILASFFNCHVEDLQIAQT